MKPKTKKLKESVGTFTTGTLSEKLLIKGDTMDHDKRLQKLEEDMKKILGFLPNVEVWINVLAAQFQTNRNFILSLDKKPEAAKEEVKPEATPNA